MNISDSKLKHIMFKSLYSRKNKDLDFIKIECLNKRKLSRLFVFAAIYIAIIIFFVFFLFLFL